MGECCEFDEDTYMGDAIDRLSGYEDSDLEPEQVIFCKQLIESAFGNDMSIINRLRELQEYDKQGRIVIAPRKVVKVHDFNDWIDVTLESEVTTCPKCHGRGKIIGFDDPNDMDTMCFRICDRCDGTGNIKKGGQWLNINEALGG